MHHRTEYGEKLKLLTVVDEFTRECLEIRVEKKMDSMAVMETLDEIMRTRVRMAAHVQLHIREKYA